MKNLVLTVNFGKLPPWAVSAKSHQLADWLKPNQEILGIKNIIIFPDTSETKLFWLDGDINNPQDVEEIKQLSNKFKPILSAIINTKIEDKNDPGYKKAMEDLKQLRDLQLAKKAIKDTKKK